MLCRNEFGETSLTQNNQVLQLSPDVQGGTHLEIWQHTTCLPCMTHKCPMLYEISKFLIEPML